MLCSSKIQRIYFFGFRWCHFGGLRIYWHFLWIHGLRAVAQCACLVQSGRWVGRHDDVIKRKHFLRYWPFVRGIHRWPVNSLHKGPWRGALMFSLICAWTNGWVNNRNASDLRRNRANYDITVMLFVTCFMNITMGIATEGCNCFPLLTPKW